MAQRRLRAFGMLGSVGATGRNIRLVTVANGAFAGVSGALAGAALGLAAWFAYVPHLQAAAGHVIDPVSLPWPAIAIAMALAVITAVAAAWRPGRSAARMPVVTALSPGGRRRRRHAPLRRGARPYPSRGRARCLAFAGWVGHVLPTAGRDTLLLSRAIVATCAGGLLLAPLGVAVARGTAAGTPRFAVRLAPARPRPVPARSGAAWRG